MRGGGTRVCRESAPGRAARQQQQAIWEKGELHHLSRSSSGPSDSRPSLAAAGTTSKPSCRRRRPGCCCLGLTNSRGPTGHAARAAAAAVLLLLHATGGGGRAAAMHLLVACTTGAAAHRAAGSLRQPAAACGRGCARPPATEPRIRAGREAVRSTRPGGQPTHSSGVRRPQAPN